MKGNLVDRRRHKARDMHKALRADVYADKNGVWHAALMSTQPVGFAKHCVADMFSRREKKRLKNLKQGRDCFGRRIKESATEEGE